jgi:hypothetical protein
MIIKKRRLQWKIGREEKGMMGVNITKVYYIYLAKQHNEIH